MFFNVLTVGYSDDERENPPLNLFSKTVNMSITTAKSHGGLPLQTEEQAREIWAFFFTGRLGFIVGVLAEDNEALQDGGDGEILLCGQLRPLSMGQKHRGGVGLEACDGFGFTRLTHHIHSLETGR